MKRITILGEDGNPAIPGVQIKLEDTATTGFAIYDKGDLRRTFLGNNLNVSRKEDGESIFSNVPFNQIQNGNNANAVFATLLSLQSFIGSNFFRKAGGGAGTPTTDAGALTSGTLADQRLSGNVPIKVGGKIQASDLPSYVDDVLEYANLAALPATGAAGVIYVTLDTNFVYRWTGSTYLRINQQDLSAYATIASLSAYATNANLANYAPLTTLVSSLDGLQVLGNPNWAGTNSANIKAPIVGGRERPNRIIGKRTLAHLATKADTNQSGLASLTDTFSYDALYGTNVLRYVSVASTALTLAPAAANAVSQNVTGGLIRWTYCPVLNVNTYLDRFSLELHSAGTPSAPTANYHAIDAINSVSDFKMRLTSLAGQGRFQSWNIPVSMFAAVGSGADLTAITFARVVLRSSGGSMTIDIGNIEWLPNKLTKAKCIFTWDDGYQSQATVVHPLLAKYAFPAVMYPGAIGGFLDINNSFVTSKNLKNLQNNHGWQVAAQAFSTEAQAVIDAKSEAQFTADMVDLVKLYKSFGLSGWQDGSYFSGVGATDNIARPVFEKMFRTMRTFNSGNASGNPFIYPETFPFGDNHLVKSLNIATSSWGVNTGAQIKAHIDQAILHKAVAIFTGHDDIKTATSNVKDGFIQNLAYLDTIRDSIDPCTMEDLFNIV